MRKLINTRCKICELKTYSKSNPKVTQTSPNTPRFISYCPKLGTEERCNILLETLRRIKFYCLDYIPYYQFFYGKQENTNWKWIVVDQTNIKNKKYVGEGHYLCGNITRNNAEFRYTNWSACKVKG